MKLSFFFLLCSLLGSTVFLSSCTSDETHYYSLSPVSSSISQANRVFDPKSFAAMSVIEVRTPSITARLDRDSIVKGSKNYRLNIEKSAAWASPPDEMIGHILAEDLSQRMAGKIVFAQNDSVSVPPQLYIELSLTHFELDQSGHAVIEGIISFHKAGTKAEDAEAMAVHWISPHIIEGGMDNFVAALSEGLGAISDQVVERLGS